MACVLDIQMGSRSFLCTVKCVLDNTNEKLLLLALFTPHNILYVSKSSLVHVCVYIMHPEGICHKE